jgi:hypothetical protein
MLRELAKASKPSASIENSRPRSSLDVAWSRTSSNPVMEHDGRPWKQSLKAPVLPTRAWSWIGEEIRYPFRNINSSKEDSGVLGPLVSSLELPSSRGLALLSPARTSSFWLRRSLLLRQLQATRRLEQLPHIGRHSSHFFRRLRPKSRVSDFATMVRLQPYMECNHLETGDALRASLHEPSLPSKVRIAQTLVLRKYTEDNHVSMW